MPCPDDHVWLPRRPAFAPLTCTDGVFGQRNVELPETMRRAMARQAEAERDRRAKVIHAPGEFEAAETLGRAVIVLEAHPAAMQLRVLSTMTEVASE